MKGTLINVREAPPVLDPEAPEKEHLTVEVSRILREEIVEGILEPNQRIKQDAVAQRLGVSRHPVREALRELASEGLVRLEKDVGASVTALDPAELVEVYLMREAIEPIVIAETTRRISEADLAEARRINGESERCAERDDIPGYIRSDRLFHFRLLEASGLDRICDVASGLWQTTHRYRRVYTFLPHRIEISVAEHRLLLDAIERRAAEDAAELYRVHTRRTRLTLVDHAELFGEAS